MLASCGPSTVTREVRGVITDLRVRNLARAESITLRADSGETLELAVADTVEFTAGHLREHMVFADPVTVTLESRPGGPTAIAITD